MSYTKPAKVASLPTNPPLIGIWWDHEGQLAVFTEQPDSSKAVHGISDSDFAHDDCWVEAAKQLAISPDFEYFDVPRGRVMWHVKNSRSVILHGNATSNDRLEVVANAFHLLTWEAATDLHYMIGDVADKLFVETNELD